MPEHKFRFRYSAEYETKDNTVSKIIFEHRVGNQWQEYDPRNYAAGFLILLYAIIDCQHMYLRINAAERGVVLVSSMGTLDVQTNENWELQKMHIKIEGQLRSGKPDADDISYITDRMGHCPVSVNLKAIPDLHVDLVFQ